MKWFAPPSGGYSAIGAPKGPGLPPKVPAVAPKKNMVDIDEVIEYLEDEGDYPAAYALAVKYKEADND